MKVKYDKEQDILYLSFSDEAIYESDEEKSCTKKIIRLPRLF